MFNATWEYKKDSHEFTKHVLLQHWNAILGHIIP